MDALRQLFISTTALYDRFDVSDIKPDRRRRIFMEEVLEFIEASVMLDVYQDFPREQEALTNEAADVFVTVMGLLLSHDIGIDELEAAIERVAAKNDAKTPNTHRLINGKIARIDAP